MTILFYNALLTPAFKFVKAKFRYASWFEAGRRQVRSWSSTSFEPSSVMESGFYLLPMFANCTVLLVR